MPIAVCTGSETPETDACTAQADLQPISVQVVGPVFAPMSATDFVVSSIMVFGIFAVVAALRNIEKLFNWKV